MKSIKEREEFLSQERDYAQDIKDNGVFCAYRLKKTGQAIIEYVVESGLGGEEVDIAQITDMHLNYCNKEDESDPEIMHTKECRKWVSDGFCAKPIEKAMDAAEYFDQTVITGDTLDYLSRGALELTKKLIFDRDPNVLVAMGGHDYSKNVETGLPDKLSFSEREQILKNAWIHDIHYASRVVKNKVIAVAIDNGPGHYHPDAISKLKADIEKARKEHMIILLFEHEPICTGDKKDEHVPAIWVQYNFSGNFYSDYVCCSEEMSNDTDRAVYKLICENADVIKGVFCGHYHSVFYTEIHGSFTDENGVHEALIPQFATAGNTYFGSGGVVTRIIVK